MTSAIVVGSGPNGLAAALTLADAGLQVTILEAADTLGGGTRSSELTLAGLIHDECSAAHPLTLDTPFTRQFDLGAHGLRWRWPEVQYAHLADPSRARDGIHPIYSYAHVPNGYTGDASAAIEAQIERFARGHQSRSAPRRPTTPEVNAAGVKPSEGRPSSRPAAARSRDAAAAARSRVRVAPRRA